MTDETTTEQLAEIDRDMADIDRRVAELQQEAAEADYKTQELPDKTQELETKTQELPEYTPPDRWRVLEVGEVLRDGDVWVNHNGESRPTKRVGERVNDERYIRRIEPQPEPVPEPVQVREGRWRTRGGEEKKIRPCEPLKGAYYVWPWTDGFMTFQDNGLHQGSKESDHDLLEYLGPIEHQPEPNAATIDELRSEVSYVQRLLGESRQRVTQLEELVASLRTINVTQEKAFTAAGKANTDLQHRLNVVAAEWAEQAETIRRLQIELDAAQQVPQAIADRFEEGWNQGTARAVEAVLAWLEPVRLVDNPNLANEAMQHLPQIMRHLTGLAQD